MEPRIDFQQASPQAIKSLMALEGVIAQLGLDPRLLELVKLRASQINGCAYCVDMHSADLRAQGEHERRLSALPVWRETPFYSARERAALAWTEDLTLLPQSGASDAAYRALAEHFSDAEQVNLSLAIGVINTWNRLAVGFRKMPAEGG